MSRAESETPNPPVVLRIVNEAEAEAERAWGPVGLRGPGKRPRLAPASRGASAPADSTDLSVILATIVTSRLARSDSPLTS
jgi:hypothetical protein